MYNKILFSLKTWIIIILAVLANSSDYYVTVTTVFLYIGCSNSFDLQNSLKEIILFLLFEYREMKHSNNFPTN